MKADYRNSQPHRILFRFFAVLFVLCGTNAFASVHTISISSSSVSPTPVTITVGDTVRWINSTQFLAEVQCGPGYPGTSIPEGLDPFELTIAPASTAYRKISASGSYNYKVLVSGAELFGQLIAVSPLPVELTDFVATTIKNEVILDWATGGEINNEKFEIQRVRVDRKTEGNSILNFETIGILKGLGNTNNIHNYTYIDRNLESGKYLYRLKQFDYNGNFVYHTLSSEIEIGLPVKFRVSQNFPNPFNPETVFGIDIPDNGHLKATLYNVSGKEIGVVFNNAIYAGYRLLKVSGSSLNSGYYFLLFEFQGAAGIELATKKMMLLK